MPWTVPDKGEGDHDHQSILFQEYLDVLLEGVRGVNCVISGCAITGGADMTPAVAAGVVKSQGVYFLVTAGDVTIGTADATNPRIDLIVVNSSGTKAVRAGTAAANPKPPARAAGDVVLGAVYVPANDTSIETTKVVDLRVIRDQGDPGHLWDLTASNAADANNDITVSAGEAVAEGQTQLMVLTAAITKQLDAAWAVGTNAGGLNTGSKAANTWYEVHLIQRSDTGVVDVMFTTTANRATLPTSYDRQRRIGWIRTDGSSNIRAFTQVGDYFTLTTQINDAGATITATATAVTLTAPPNSIARFRATAQITALTAAAVTGIVFSEIVEGNVTPAITTGILSLAMSEGDGTGTANDSGAAGHFELRVNGSSQIEWDGIVGAGSAGEVFDISTFGWIDRRRRLETL